MTINCRVLILSYLFCNQILLGFPFISGFYASFVVEERESKAKHLQTVAGVEQSSYWISTLLWDSMNFVFPLVITIILMFAFNLSVFTTSERDTFSGVFALMIFYGPAAAGWAYCFSFMFTSPTLCNVILIILSFLISFGGAIAAFILTLLSGLDDLEGSSGTLTTAANCVNWILRFFPPFCLGKGLLFVINAEIIGYLEEDFNLSVWTNPILRIEVIFLLAESIGYTFLAMCLDLWSSNPRVMALCKNSFGLLTFSWLFRTNEPDITVALPEDEDVIAEQERVLGGGANEDLVVISELTKMYSGGKLAVNNMSLGIAPGECFGLLGINGKLDLCLLSELFYWVLSLTFLSQARERQQLWQC